ncbi:MAG: hypothetical protein K6U75_06785 [Firmicutes bacterium]|nr:hypothetical protein [Bacillota bacterium]
MVINQEYRPESYFELPLRDQVMRNLGSSVLRLQIASEIDRLLRENQLEYALELVMNAAMKEPQLEQVHPAFMGGMYLPELEPGEVEVARIILHSTTSDTYAVYAKPQGASVRLRLVDEYGGECLLGEVEQLVEQPMTQREIVDWVIACCALDELAFQFDGDVEATLQFISATSPVYPQFEALLKRRLQDIITQA